jgi:lipoprotein-releasing system ATP-binding protein
MLEAQAVSRWYATRAGRLEVLREVSLTVAPGESAAIMGPSGSGKSTFLNILGTLDRPSAGRVTLNDCDPFTLDERELARFRNRRIGFIFQDHHLLPQCNVVENVLIPTLADREGQSGLSRAQELLDRVGLAGRLDHRPAELSGGEKQRVAIARALIRRPAVVLADEPTGNLDRASAEVVADLLSEIPRDEGSALVVVTHSQRLADRFPRVYDLSEGRLEPRT